MSAAPSAPPPAMAIDLAAVAADDELDAYGESAVASRKRKKIVGAAFGGMAVLGIIIAAITSSSSPKPAEPAAAAAQPPPPVATFVAPPPPAPDPAPVPPPPATGAATKKGDKPDYTPKTAAAAYAASQGKKTPAFKVGSGKVGGVKMQKVQSSGTQ